MGLLYFVVKQKLSSCHNVFHSSVHIIKVEVETLLLSFGRQHTLPFQHHLSTLSQQGLHAAEL